MQTFKTVVIAGLCVVLLNGCATTDMTTVWFHEQVPENLPESHVRQVQIKQSGARLAVNPFPILTEKNLLGAKQTDLAGNSTILLFFDSHGAFILDEVTTRLQGQYLVVFLNRQPIMAWLVDHRLTDGQFLLETGSTAAEAAGLVKALNETIKQQHRDSLW